MSSSLIHCCTSRQIKLDAFKKTLENSFSLTASVLNVSMLLFFLTRFCVCFTFFVILFCIQYIWVINTNNNNNSIIYSAIIRIMNFEILIIFDEIII